MSRFHITAGRAQLDTAAIFSPSPPPKEERFPRTDSRFEPLNRGTVPGSAGVSPASSGFRLPTGRRDAGAPRRFMSRVGVRRPIIQAQIPSPQPSSRLGGERESAAVSNCVTAGIPGFRHPNAPPESGQVRPSPAKSDP